jgi:PilZ domain
MPNSTEQGQETTFPAEKGGPERRRNLRFPFSASVEVTETKSGAKIAGRTSDLGLGGCYVDAISPFPVGSEAQVRIRRGDQYFEAQVKVVYSQIGMGMGLAFVSAQPKHYRLFQQWLLEISGKAPALADPTAKEREEVAPASAGDETSNVLNELLIALVRKRVLSEEEGKALLKKLHQ